MEVNSASDIFVLHQRHPSYIFYNVLADIWGAIHPVLCLLKKLLVSP